jgi:hypothetical protein
VHDRIQSDHAQAFKGNPSFLKKRSKKLLITLGFGDGGANAHRNQKFFGYFFSKK